MTEFHTPLVEYARTLRTLTGNYTHRRAKMHDYARLNFYSQFRDFIGSIPKIVLITKLL
jgi:hypothetical protein